MSYDDNWLKLQDWITEKMKNCDGALIPMIQKRPEAELDYQVMLENASRTMIRFKRPERLIKVIVRIIDEQVKVSHTAMLVFQKDKNAYVLIDSKGAEGVKIPVGYIRLSNDNPLIGVFQNRYNYKISETGALEYKSLLDFLHRSDELKKNEELREIFERALKQMELLKSNICVPIFYKKDLIGVLVLGKKLSNVKFSRQEIGFFTTLANDVAMAIANAQLIQDLQDKIFEVHDLYEREHKIFIHTSISLAAAIDARDPYTHGHTERVTQIALIIADELQDMPEAQSYKNFKETLHVASLLHDVGKIGVPDSILNKKSQLTKEEYEKVKEHSVTGAAILYPIRELGDIAREVRGHHERYDGAGYPDGLKGEDIPFVARIIAVADTFDAITSDRPYRQKKMAEIAMQIVKGHSGRSSNLLLSALFF
jgi:HD-GYP domain-containing protein (c-di-GMP phosphodiesterase class II)